jgi:hypothetical protein
MELSDIKELEGYTNTSVQPLGELEGIPIRPCMKSGFCCIKAPCAYGEWNENKSACKHLTEPNDLGQRDCMKYEWIIENVPTYMYHPAFGTGCSSAIGNLRRMKIIKEIIDRQK